MEKFEVALEKAHRKLMIADHMISVTYPLLKDNKLLVAALENVFLALTKAMGALLYYERLYKRIPPFHDTYESKFNMFKFKMMKRYNFPKSILILMEDIKTIIMNHRKSPVEFARKDMFVICTKEYTTHTVTYKSIKEYVQQTKTFLKHIDRIVKNERIATPI